MPRLWRTQDEGYTLTELMFVMVILAILVFVAIAAFVAATERAELTACRANVRIIQGAVYAYQATEDGSLPTTLTDIDPFVQSPDIFDCCPSDESATYDYDPSTGVVTCPLHP